MQLELHVENIKCGGCAGTIRNTLLKDPRVSEVEVEVETGTVRIEASEDISRNLAAELTRIGYPEAGSVQGYQSAKAKARSFVSCAIGRTSKA